MPGHHCRIVYGAFSALVGLAGCGREAPPEIRQFVPPVRVAMVEDEPTTQPVVESAPEETAPPASAPAPASAPVAVAADIQPAEPELEPEAPQEPSILGTWQVTDMSRNGESQPFPPGMVMTWTFTEDGTMTVSMAGGPGGMSQERQGSYSVDGTALSISMENESKTGTLAFKGNDRMIVDVDEMKMTLTRQ